LQVQVGNLNKMKKSFCCAVSAWELKRFLFKQITSTVPVSASCPIYIIPASHPGYVECGVSVQRPASSVQRPVRLRLHGMRRQNHDHVHQLREWSTADCRGFVVLANSLLSGCEILTHWTIVDVVIA